MVLTAERNLKPEDLIHPSCRRIYKSFLSRFHGNLPCDLISLIEDDDDQHLISEMMEKKVNCERVEESYVAAIQKVLDRNWMEKREGLRTRIQSGQCTDEEALELLKEFDRLKKEHPKAQLLSKEQISQQMVDPKTGELIEN